MVAVEGVDQNARQFALSVVGQLLSRAMTNLQLDHETSGGVEHICHSLPKLQCKFLLHVVPIAAILMLSLPPSVST